MRHTSGRPTSTIARATCEAEARAVLQRAAVVVGAAVVERREEVRRQVAVRAVDLDEVEPGALRQLGGVARSRRRSARSPARVSSCGTGAREFSGTGEGATVGPATTWRPGCMSCTPIVMSYGRSASTSRFRPGRYSSARDVRLGALRVGRDEAALDGDRPHAALGAAAVVRDRGVGDMTASSRQVPIGAMISRLRTAAARARTARPRVTGPQIAPRSASTASAAHGAALRDGVAHPSRPHRLEPAPCTSPSQPAGRSSPASRHGRLATRARTALTRLTWSGAVVTHGPGR